MVGIATSLEFTKHNTGPSHPERPDRIRAILAAIDEAGLRKVPDYTFLDFTPADESILRLVHPQSHIDQVKRVCEVGGVLDLGDTPVNPGSYETALLAVGAILRCCDAVMSGEVIRAFAAVRPPGHHAETNRAMGFCLFSNIAIAARYLQTRHKLARIAIVDFDVHHGNGTQEVFFEDPSVLFISLHEDPRVCYPRTGYEWETGASAGEGFTLNIPFNPGAGDADYEKAFDTKVIPKLTQFKPDFLLISAGFDAHREDPLAHIELSDAAYETMTRTLVKFADAHCAGRIVSALEGGYNLKALGRSVVRHLKGLLSPLPPGEG